MAREMEKEKEFIRYEDGLESGKYVPVRPEDLKNESLAYLLGKWLRSLHAVPAAEPGAEWVRQEMWPVGEVRRLTDVFLNAYAPAGEDEICRERAERFRESAALFVPAFRKLPRVCSFREFDTEHILVSRDRTKVLVRIDPVIGYRYADICAICSRLQFWGQWAFLWGYAVPVSGQERRMDRLSEVLSEIRKEEKKEQPDFGRTVRLLQDTETGKALDALEEERNDDRAV